MAKKKSTKLETADNPEEEAVESNRGRPKLITEAFENTLLRLAEKGFTDREMCLAIGIGERTLYDFKKANPKFSQTLKGCKRKADEIVERSLYQLAIGYEHPEEKVFCTKDGDIVTHDTIKIYPPNATAAIFWLKNRDPNRWREKLEHDIPKGGGLAELIKLAAQARRERDARKTPAR